MIGRVSRITTALGGAVAIVASSAGATAAATGGGFASSTPASNTPHLALNTPTVQQVRQLVQCGSTMYAVGTFTTIKQGSQTFTRNGAFSFSAVAPYTMTGWDPEVNGTVNTIAFNGGDCSNAYLGGNFSAVGPTAAKKIAEVSTSTGAVVSSFARSASAKVETITSWGGHLLVGGYFTTINGSKAAPYFTSLNPVTGKDDGFLNLGISGNYQFVDWTGRPAASNSTRVYNAQLSPDNRRLLVEGDFTSIGGQPRQQVAMLDLGSTSATTDAWYPTEFNQPCVAGEPFYAQAGAWSPDGATVYVATTGYRPATGPDTGMCDASIALPTSSGQVTHTWVNYTGCDSLYAAGADATTSYFGGHERWASNPFGCDSAGPGAIPAAGFVGLSPANGSVTFNPQRARGLGADDILVTSGGVWIASDNMGNADKCGGQFGHSGICLFAY